MYGANIVLVSTVPNKYSRISGMWLNRAFENVDKDFKGKPQ